MTPSDYPEFHQAWVNSHAMSSSNQTPADSVVMAVFDLLAEYPLQHVVGALRVHAKKSRFAPTPSDVCDIIDARTKQKHIGADEAWAIALQSMDEAETVVWTKQIAEARSIASDMFASGDKTGARMAFREAYNRIIATAGDPAWQVCAGWDSARRVEAINAAKLLGRLPQDYALNKHLLPAPEARVTVVALLEGAREKIDHEQVKRGVAMLRMALNHEANIDERTEKRQKFEAKKVETLAAVASRLGELH